jgi:RNA polymerase sigma-70 factor (ECF subfamily)
VHIAPGLSYDDDLAAAEPSQADTNLEAFRREAAREVRSALSVLPVDQMRVIELAYFGGLTHSEIAEMLGMPLGTVKGRMRLGMEKIRTQLAEEI